MTIFEISVQGKTYTVYFLVPIVELWRDYRDIYPILEADAKRVAAIFATAKPELADQGIVVRFAEPRLDFELTNDKWEVSLSAGTDQKIYEVKLPDTKAIVVRGFRIPSPNPLIDLIYLKKDKLTSEKILVRSVRDPNTGFCLFRRSFKYEPGRTVTIMGNVNTSGSEIVEVVALVAEQVSKTVDWFEKD